MMLYDTKGLLEIFSQRLFQNGCHETTFLEYFLKNSQNNGIFLSDQTLSSTVMKKSLALLLNKIGLQTVQFNWLRL